MLQPAPGYLFMTHIAARILVEGHEVKERRTAHNSLINVYKGISDQRIDFLGDVNDRERKLYTR